jgi:hypothetical protein
MRWGRKDALTNQHFRDITLALAMATEHCLDRSAEMDKPHAVIGYRREAERYMVAYYALINTYGDRVSRQYTHAKMCDLGTRLTRASLSLAPRAGQHEKKIDRDPH